MQPWWWHKDSYSSLLLSHWLLPHCTASRSRASKDAGDARFWKKKKKKSITWRAFTCARVFLFWGRRQLVVVIVFFFFFFLVIKMKMSKRLSLELITSYPVSKASLYPNANLVWRPGVKLYPAATVGAMPLTWAGQGLNSYWWSLVRLWLHFQTLFSLAVASNMRLKMVKLR